MAKIRPASCYKKIEKPYTRKSRYRRHSYVPGSPHSKINIFHMGDRKGEFTYRISLYSQDPVQIRNNALEAARIASNKFLVKNLGKSYHFVIKVYPHHIIRENPIAKGAGADRFQKGMKHAFGKPIGSAAQVKKGQEIMYVEVDKENIDKAKIALNKAGKKLPCKHRIEVREVSA